MDEEVPYSLKLTFLVHAIITGVVGVQHVIAPRVWTDLAGMEVIETVTWRVIGAAVLGFAVSSWLAYRERLWERVRIIVVTYLIWLVVGAAAITWGIVVGEAPPLEWVNVGLMAGFAAVFGFFYRRMEWA